MDQINEKLNNEDFKNYNEETAETPFLFVFNIFENFCKELILKRIKLKSSSLRLKERQGKLNHKKI